MTTLCCYPTRYPSCLISAGRPGGQLSFLTWFWSPQEQRKTHIFFWLILLEAELNVQCVFNQFWQWCTLQLSLYVGATAREHHCSTLCFSALIFAVSYTSLKLSNNEGIVFATGQWNKKIYVSTYSDDEKFLSPVEIEWTGWLDSTNSVILHPNLFFIMKWR